MVLPHGESKGSGIHFLRTQIQTKVIASEPAFLEKLTPEEVDIYHKALPVNWFPTENYTSIISKGMEFLYPGNPDALKAFGEALGDEYMNRVYKFLVRMTSISFLMSMVAKIWSMFQKRGLVTSETLPDQTGGVVVVRDFKEMLPEYRQIVMGYIICCVKIMKVKNIEIHEEFCENDVWKFVAKWEK